MSYINEALKKAQKEKDALFLKYSGILSSRGRDREVFKSRVLWVTLALLSAIFVYGTILLTNAGIGLQCYIEWLLSLLSERDSHILEPSGRIPRVFRENGYLYRRQKPWYQGSLP